MRGAPGLARHIGRVGALAVAFGIGVSAASTPGVGWAQTETDAPPSPVSTPEPAQPAPAEPTQGPAPATANPAAEPSEPVGDTASTETVSVGDSPEVTVSSSGGARTSGKYDGSEAGETVVEPEAPAVTTEVVTATAAPVAASQPPPTVAPLSEPAPVVVEVDLNGAKRSTPTTTLAKPRPSAWRVDPEPSTADDVETDSLSWKASTDPADEDAAVADPVATVPFVGHRQPLRDARPTTGVMALPNAFLSVASGLIAAVLNPFLVSNPAEPLEPPVLWALLAWVRRQFANQRPAVLCTAPDATEPLGTLKLTFDSASADRRTVDPVSGVVTGALSRSDAGYAVTSTPGSGAVVVAGDTYSYTPTMGARLRAGSTLLQQTDRFAVAGRSAVASDTVSVVVAPAHLASETVIATAAGPTQLLNSGDRLLVLHANTGTVGVLDTATAEARDVDIGASTAGAMAVVGERLFVTRPSLDDMVVVDLATGEHVGIAIWGNPVNVTAAPDGSRIYAADPAFGRVAVIGLDPGDDGLVGAIEIDSPGAMAMSPDGRRLYVGGSTADAGADNVIVVDTDPRSATYHAMVGSVRVDSGVFTLAVSPDGRRLYAADTVTPDLSAAGKTLSIVDIDSDSPTFGSRTAVVVGALPTGLAVSPDGDVVFVATATDLDPAEGSILGAVAVVDARSDRVVDTIPVGAGPTSIALSDDGTRVYVANFLDETVSVLTRTPGRSVAPRLTASVAADADPVSGAVTVHVTAADAPGAALSLTATEPGNGKVTVTPGGAGHYALTYTPTATARLESADAPGAVDAFSVAVSNGRRATATTVSVPVTPQQAWLGATDPTLSVDHETGWVTGSVFTAPPEGDLTYDGTGDTPHGRVIVYEDGSYLYQPTTDARRHAAGGLTDTFAVTVSDLRGGTLAVPITVEVLPAG